MDIDIEGFESSDELYDHLISEGHDEESAQAIVNALEKEAESDNGDESELWNSIQNAAGMILDASIDLNSAVDVPAINSKWTVLKSDGDSSNNRRIDAQIVFKQESEQSDERRISYAPAMIPREPDKEGEVVPTHVVENSAHDYLKQGGGVDTDHSLIDGKGQPVESWIEPESRTWDLPDGGTQEYPAGTWMLGVEWQKEPWERIKEGELTGLSIYGMAEHVSLKSKSVENSTNEDTPQGETTKPSETKAAKQEQSMEQEDLENLTETVSEISDTQSTIVDTLDTLKDAHEASEETPEGGEGTSTDSTDKSVSELVDETVSTLASHDDVDVGAETLKDAITDSLEKEDNGDKDDEEDEDEEESSKGEGETTEGGEETEKSREETAKYKGTNGEGVRNQTVEEKQQGGSTGLPSYQSVAENHE